MNNEPVAWMNEEEIGIMYAMKIQGAKDWKTNLGLVPEENDIPLYTHPAKTLTDDVAKHHYNKGHEDGRNLAIAKTLTDEEIDSIWAEMSEQCDEEFIDMKQFARAILKKAQEK